MSGGTEKKKRESVGPAVEYLSHRLSQCPAEFLMEPRLGIHGDIVVNAVVNDLVRDLGGKPLSSKELAPFSSDSATDRNFLRLVLISCWLFHDSWFREREIFAEDVYRWLTGGIRNPAGLVAAELFVGDPDRREELVRLSLRALKLRPEGESRAQAVDRLSAIDSVERRRIIRETREKEEAARKLREAMERKRAREAAAKASREY
jgi:hypothetical protein